MVSHHHGVSEECAAIGGLKTSVGLVASISGIGEDDIVAGPIGTDIVKLEGFQALLHMGDGRRNDGDVRIRDEDIWLACESARNGLGLD